MKRFVLVCVAILVLAGAAQADVIAHWDMYGVGTVDSVSGYGSDNVTAYDMILGEGLGTNSASNALNSNGWADNDDGNYIQFGFSVADGYEVSLGELWIGSKASASGPHSMGIYSSLDDYTNLTATITLTGTDYSNEILDLSSLDAISGDFYVRIYGSGATSSNGTFRITDYYENGSYTDVQFTGTVSASAVPVPAAIWLLGSGLLGLLSIRGRKA